MPEVYGALIGAAATAFLMVLSNVSNRRERDIRELFNRINQLEKSVSRIEGQNLLCLVCLECNTYFFYV